MGRRKGKISKKARHYIMKKVDILIHDEGYQPKQAVAIAYSKARRKGYRIPKK